MKFDIGNGKAKTQKISRGDYAIVVDGAVVGRVHNRSDDWYGEMIVDGAVYTNGCGDSMNEVIWSMIDDRRSPRRIAYRKTPSGRAQNAQYVTRLRGDLPRIPLTTRDLAALAASGVLKIC